MAQIQVVAGIVWKDGKYLAALRPEGFPRAGFWEFPGGKIEQGESQEEALIREFQEEMSIRPTKYSFWQTITHEYSDMTVALYFYHITAFEGTIIPQEGYTTRWLSYDDATALPFLEADRPLLEELKTSPFAT